MMVRAVTDFSLFMHGRRPSGAVRKVGGKGLNWALYNLQ